MANPVVKIVLQAVDEMSKVLSGAAGNVKSFGQSVKKEWDATGASVRSLTGEFKELLNNKLVQGLGFGAMLAALKSSWQQADAFDASLRKLSATAKITEVPLAVLEQIANQGKDAFKLSTIQANDYAVELAKLASKAGNVGAAGPGLQAFLDIGAARGLDAAATLKAVQQSILGIDEGTDKLFNKNPSVIYAEFADKIGTTAGKLTDQQKAQALLNAAMEDGSKVRGEYSRWLETTAGLQFQASVKVQEAQVALGKATDSIRTTFLPVIGWAAEKVQSFIGGIQLLGVDAAYYFSLIGPAVRDMAGNVLLDLSHLVGESRVILTLFGDAAVDIADRMGNAGVKIKTNAQKDRRNLVTARDEMYKEIVAVSTSGEAKVTAEMLKGKNERGKISDEEKKEREKVATDLAVAVIRIEKGWTDDQAREHVRRRSIITGEAATLKGSLLDGYAQLDRANLILAAGFDKVVPKVKATTSEIKTLDVVAIPHGDVIQRLADKYGISADAIKEFVEGKNGSGTGIKGFPPIVRDAAAAVAGLGQSLGLMDAEAASAVTSAVGLGDAIKRMAGGDPTAFIGAIGSVAGVFNSLFGDAASAEAKRVLGLNTQRLKELADITGDLVDAQTSGRNFAKILDVLSKFEILRGPAGLEKVLQDAGLTLNDLDTAAKDLGVTLRDKDGKITTGGMEALMKAIQRADTGAANSFAGKVRTLDTGLQIGTVNTADEFGALVNAAGPDNAISRLLGGLDLNSATGRGQGKLGLQGLFGDLSSGKLKLGDLGGLSRKEFEGLIVRLLGILTSDQEISGIPVTPDLPPLSLSLSDGFDGTVQAIDTTNLILNDILKATLGQPVGAGVATAAGVAGAESGTRIGAVTINVTALPGQNESDIAQRVVDELLALQYDAAQAVRGSVVRT